MASTFNSMASNNSFTTEAAVKTENKTDVSDKQTLLAVLQFLKKNNLKVSDEVPAWILQYDSATNIVFYLD